MLKKSLLGTVFGLAFLPIVSVTASANIASMTQTAIGASDTMVVQVAKRKGGGAHHTNKGAHKSAKKNVNVNKNVNRNVNKNVNRNVNVKKNVNVNRNVNV